MDREAWTPSDGKTALTLAEFDNADLVGEQLVNAVGTRDQTTRAPSRPTRSRSASAPSLYAGCARRKTDVPPKPREPPFPGGRHCHENGVRRRHVRGI